MHILKIKLINIRSTSNRKKFWVTWIQHTEALSTTEAEYMSLSVYLSETCCIKNILKDLGIKIKLISLLYTKIISQR